MTGTTFALYALLILGDGQDTEVRHLQDGLTGEQCFAELQAHKPSVATIDLGYGLEDVATVYGCEQESLAEQDEPRVSTRSLFEAAEREDWQ